jgi:DNA-binding GntR family transcriptional regulator
MSSIFLINYKFRITSMEAAKKIINNKQPLGATAYEKIYRKIISLEYEPGQRLEENQLVKQLEIGRTPIREALLNLSADMMVQSQPNKGFVVSPITLQKTKAAFAALKILELGIASLAVQQDVKHYLSQMEIANQAVKDAMVQMDILRLVEANSTFHIYFARCSNNEYLIQGLHKVRCETNRLAYLSYGNEIDPCKSLHDHYESVVGEHNEIVTCIKNRDEAGLKETICRHIKTFQKRVIHYMAS